MTMTFIEAREILTSEQIEQLSACVDRGAALLDVALPDWRGKINTWQLAMNDPQRCILGQLYGSYPDGIEQLGMNGQLRTDRFAHGFSVSGDAFPCWPVPQWDEAAWAALDHLWTEKINGER